MTNKTTQDRRTAFYAAESEERLPEEPNIRVYGRCISAALEVARRGLGRKAFSSLMLWLVDEARDLGADIHANPTPEDAQKAPRAIHVPPLTPEQEKAVESLPKEPAQIRYVSDREDDKTKCPALSPRQALGEALACVERAASLVKLVCEPTPPSVFKVGNLLLDAEAELRRAYEAAK